MYEALRELLEGEIQAETVDEFVERASVPGLLTGRTVKLFSGQVVPVIEPQNRRGLFGWHTNALVSLALKQAKIDFDLAQGQKIRDSLSGFLKSHLLRPAKSRQDVARTRAQFRRDKRLPGDADLHRSGHAGNAA